VLTCVTGTALCDWMQCNPFERRSFDGCGYLAIFTVDVCVRGDCAKDCIALQKIGSPGRCHHRFAACAQTSYAACCHSHLVQHFLQVSDL
jgi:hypothetical protein